MITIYLTCISFFRRYIEMKQILKRIWKQIICKHEYRYSHSFMIHDGMRKTVVHKCDNCGKEKLYYV